MAAEPLLIPPSDLLLDEENPRLSLPNAGQQRALQAMAALLDKKLVGLAADIVSHGLDPSTLPIVMPALGAPVRYIMLEGNRRLTALKVLENPDAVADAVKPKILTALRRLSRTYQENPIESVACLVVKDREVSRHWIELRHTGLNEGAGVMSWGSDDAARFKSRSGVRELHSQALDFLQQRGDLSAELRRKVPATSLKRLIETPDVRSRLGLEAQGGVLRLLADDKAVAKALMHVIHDFTTGDKKVGDIYNLAQRKKYANELPADVVVAHTIPSGRGTVASATATPKRTTKGHQRRAQKRDKLIPRDCTLNIPSGRIFDVADELKKLSLEDHTNAISVLFRVFLELSVDEYLDQHPLSGLNDQSPLYKKMTGVANDLVARRKITSQQRTPVSRACQKDSFLAPSIDLMHQYVHNKHVFPAPTDLRAHWDSLQPFIAAMWAV